MTDQKQDVYAAQWFIRAVAREVYRMMAQEKSTDHVGDTTGLSHLATQIYPWEEWKDGKVHQITAGQDYTIDTRSMRSTLKKHAARHGMRAAVRATPDGLSFQFRCSACGTTDYVLDDRGGPARNAHGCV